MMTANDTGNVTAFPLVVTREIYTLGFDPMVLDVLPNTTVENSGNSYLPPPPVRQVSFWEAAWNSFTGLVSSVWNAVVAVATFIANVALAVIRWCIDFAVAIAEGRGLEFFYDTVVKPFVEAILAFIRWIIDLAMKVLEFLFSPILDAVKRWIDDLTRTISTAFSVLEGENPSEEEHAKRSAELVVDLLLGGTLLLFSALVIALIIGETVTKPFSWLLAPILGTIALMIIGAALQLGSMPSGVPPPPGGDEESVRDQVLDYVPDDVWWNARAPFVVGRFLSTLAFNSLAKARWTLRSAASMAFAVAGLILFLIGPLLGPAAPFGSIAGIALAFLGLYFAITSELKSLYPLVYAISIMLATASVLVGLMSWVQI